MHIHLLGACGTFMAGVARIATELGHEVSGSDANVYPPMSSYLDRIGVRVFAGYNPEHVPAECELVIIGNALSRGNPAVEYVLEHNLPYISGPQWLAENVLRERHVLAIAGTHGKTTTTSLLAWILECHGAEPGFLIGGIAKNFAEPARLGRGPLFVIEADEYDTAFFDKRSKFVHYRPRTLVVNNLEFDHADIFPDLEAIKRQFHHLIRTVPGGGAVIVPAADAAVRGLLERGCWSREITFGLGDADWRLGAGRDNGCHEVTAPDGACGELKTPLSGEYNRLNCLAAIAAAGDVGVPLRDALDALARFEGVKRRLETIGVVADVTVYDDFAHHPTAIAATLEGLRHDVGQARITCVLEPRSNTMRMGAHIDALPDSLELADQVYIFLRDDLAWDPLTVLRPLGKKCRVSDDINEMIGEITRQSSAGDHVVIMSNGGFDGFHGRLLEALKRNKPSATRR